MLSAVKKADEPRTPKFRFVWNVREVIKAVKNLVKDILLL